jgi:hypothetical protein
VKRYNASILLDEGQDAGVCLQGSSVVVKLPCRIQVQDLISWQNAHPLPRHFYDKSRIWRARPKKIARAFGGETENEEAVGAECERHTDYPSVFHLSFEGHLALPILHRRRLRTRTDRDRRLIEALMAGERTMDVAAKHGLSQARVRQLRREYLEDWERFCE